jgi:hypothetical protein
MSELATEPETDETDPETDPEITFEEPDETEPDETEEEEEAESEPPPAAAQVDFDKAIKALEKETTRHSNRVSEIMGEDAQQLTPCPLCEIVTAGFVFADAIPDEHREAVIGWLRGANAPEMLPDPDAELCDTCAGYGNTLTGSQVAGNQTKMCGKCEGNGWTNPEQRQRWQMMHPPTGGQAGAVVVQLPTAPAGQVLPALDQWGRAQGTEFYGRDPQYLTGDERLRDPGSPS